MALCIIKTYIRILVEFSSNFQPNSAKWSVDEWSFGEMVIQQNGQSAKRSVGEMAFDETSRIQYMYRQMTIWQPRPDSAITITMS